MSRGFSAVCTLKEGFGLKRPTTKHMTPQGHTDDSHHFSCDQQQSYSFLFAIQSVQFQGSTKILSHIHSDALGGI
uniref:Uncharacterized protein n=1 Tax=Stegastes partitus TaxID=144197 RepID=A0A3B4ZPL1_9TELE